LVSAETIVEEACLEYKNTWNSDQGKAKSSDTEKQTVRKIVAQTFTTL